MSESVRTGCVQPQIYHTNKRPSNTELNDGVKKGYHFPSTSYTKKYTTITKEYVFTYRDQNINTRP